MPIIYVHGVNVRDESAFAGIEIFLRQYVAPKLNPQDPGAVPIVPAFWGGHAVTFAWGGQARPRTAILRKGAAGGLSASEQALVLAPFTGQLPKSVASRPFATPQGVRSMGPSESATPVSPGTSIQSMSRDQRSDLVAIALMSDAFLAATPERPVPIDASTAARIVEADRQITDNDSSPDAVVRRVPPPPIISQGAGWFAHLRDQLSEAVDRVSEAPGFLLTRSLEELRAPLNAFVTQFTGDVFVYLSRRGGKDALGVDLTAGTIPRDLLNAIRSAQKAAPAERTVVISHSMGGQLVYDAVTHFLPNDGEFSDIAAIDLWCACASQVGLFEEMKLFLVSDPRIVGPAKVPHPRGYGKVHDWLNVWDRADILSYTSAPIFQDLSSDDREFVSGASVVNAHGSYLVRPSFYRMLAGRL